MCVLIFSTILSEIFLVLRRTQWDVVINENASLYVVPVIHVRFK